MTNERTRRRYLATAVAGGALALAGCSSPSGADGDAHPSGSTGTEDDTNPAGSTGDEDRGSGTDAIPESVDLELVADGMELPVDVAVVPSADRRYVVGQTGPIYVHGSDGLGDEPVLDPSDDVVRGYEQGALAVALHPDFAENRRLFVRYSAPRRPGTPEEYNHTFVLSEFEATADGTGVRRDSERPLLEIPQPQDTHNAGAIAFGPDGYLYVTGGDGGKRYDQGMGHVEDRYDAVEGGNGRTSRRTSSGASCASTSTASRTTASGARATRFRTATRSSAGRGSTNSTRGAFGTPGNSPSTATTATSPTSGRPTGRR